MKKLRKEGFEVGRDKVNRLMDKLNLKVKQRIAYKVTTMRKHSHSVADNIESLFIWCIVEGFSYSLRWYFTDNPSFTISQENINLLFGTSMMPPLPLYIIAASSLAVIIIILSLNFAQRFKQSIFIQAFSNTGKMALTLYVAHVVIGLGIIEHLGLLENSSIETILTASLLFFGLAILFCHVWLKFFIQGPLEWLFRKLSY